MKNTLAPSKVTQRDREGGKFMQVVGDAYDKAGLAEDEAQRVNDTSGLAEHIATWIEEHRAPQSKYKGEKVNPAYGYPRKYKGPKPIEQQIKAIAKIFELDPAEALAYAKNLPALPKGAEGCFAVPSVDAVAAKHFPEVTDSAKKYCRVLQMIYQKFAASRSFTNWRERQIDTAHIKVSLRTQEMMQKATAQQKGGILIIAAQLGKRWGGYCVGLARDSFAENEHGLTSVSGGAIVLVHPERLACWEELDMDMAGDEFAGADGRFGSAPVFGFRGGGVRFGARRIDVARVGYGSASAFLPQ